MFPLIQVFPGVFNILLRILEIIGINGNVSKNQIKLKVNLSILLFRMQSLFLNNFVTSVFRRTII